jgi:hypothetical protein
VLETRLEDIVMNRRIQDEGDTGLNRKSTLLICYGYPGYSVDKI